MQRRLGLMVAILSASFLPTTRALAQEACFTRLDNGVDLTGWHKSATNHHGPGDGWKVENGAMVGRQTAGNKGGILLTDKSYKDVEVTFEVKLDWGCDSGFFFRTTAGDRAYQVTIDHLQGSGVGIVYGEGFAQELYYHPYTLTNLGNTAVKDAVLTPIFDLAKWSTIWKPTEFNQLRARVEGNPPRVQVWIAGTQVADYTDPKLRAEIDAAGPLAIQVHGGADRWIPNGSVQFKNIRVKDLAVPCADGGVDGGDAGGAGDAGGPAVADAGGAEAGGGGGAGGGGAGTGGGGAAGMGMTGGAGTGGAGAPADAGQPTGAGGATTTGAAGVTGAAGQAPPSPSTNDGGGCGCAMAESRGPGGAASIFCLLALVLRRRARRRAAPRAR